MTIRLLKEKSVLKSLVLGALIFCCVHVQGQSLSRVVIGTAGDFSDNGQYSLSWTAGEIMVQTRSSTNNFLTQGFQQSDDLTLVVPDEPQSTAQRFEFSVYPNPFRNRLTIKADQLDGENIDIYVVDMLGNVVQYNSSVASAELTGGFEVATDAWTSGIYFVRVVLDGGQVQQDLKIVKNK